MVDESAGTHEETVKTAVFVDLLDAVEKAADDVVAAGSLSAGEYHSHVERFAGGGGGVLLKSKLRHSVCVGEQFFDVVLIGYRLGGCAFYGFDCAGECDGQFGLISRAGYLQCTFLHIVL